MGIGCFVVELTSNDSGLQKPEGDQCWLRHCIYLYHELFSFSDRPSLVTSGAKPLYDDGAWFFSSFFKLPD